MHGYSSSRFSAAFQYVLLLGRDPGTTTLPNGVRSPLGLDPFVVGSISNGLSGALTNYFGTAVRTWSSCGPATRYHEYSGAIGIRHPNIPGIRGLALRAAGVGFDTGGRFAASQPETVWFR